MRREIEAQQVTPFKHALVSGERTYPVTEVRRQGYRVHILAGAWNYICAATRPVTVEVISDGDDNDPMGPQAAKALDRRAAKPSWRMGSHVHRSGRRPVRPR